MITVYYKSYNPGRAKWKRCIGQGRGGKGVEHPCPLQGCHPPSISMCSPTRSSPNKPHLELLCEVSLPRHDWLNHWALLTELNFHSFSPPWRSIWDRDSAKTCFQPPSPNRDQEEFTGKRNSHLELQPSAHILQNTTKDVDCWVKKRPWEAWGHRGEEQERLLTWHH